MDIVATTQAQSRTASSEATPQAADDAALSGDFETFLKMLTTQAQNQDPFNPVDATEYASQLASFSTVEQQVQTNELLTELTILAAGSGIQRLAGWIGMEARTPGAAYFEGAPVELFTEVPEDAQSAVLVIRDSSGILRNRLTMEPETNSYIWDGTDLSGAKVPEGLYDVELEIYRDDALEETRDVSAYVRIEEVAQTDVGNTVTLRGGAVRDAADVNGLRLAEG